LMAQRARETGNRTYFWEAHYVGRDRPYCQIERLTNLAAVPPAGSTICCFPLKVKGGSAGPARVVALVPEPSDAAC
jgi:kynurenine formamidase